MYKIAHIADTHIRNLKYHDEYRLVFNKIYADLRKKQPDVIVHCGDIAHTKTQLSPEYFVMASEFLYNLAEIAPTYVILGNHDGNLKNSNREDAITPIVEALSHKSLHLLKNSGETEVLDGLVFNVLSVFDRDNWVPPSDPDKINIALYHGAISGCKTGSGYTMTFGEDSVDIFDKFDFAMLGDIHNPQSLDMKGRIRYAGSTIQQNFGERGEKGYLFWQIEGRWKWKCDHVGITHPRPFVTVRLNKDGTFPKGTTVPPSCRLRLISTSNLPSDKIRRATDFAKIKFRPHSVSFLNGSENYNAKISKVNSKLENLRDITIQEKHIRNYLKGFELDEETIERVLELNKKYNQIAEANETVSRNVVWRIKSMEWENLFNYGGGNKINFERLNGLVGIFGKNYSGKSSVIDSALFGLYNSTSKANVKSVHIINQNKDKASIKMVLETDKAQYQITRNLNKYVKKLKGQETNEAKTDLDFTEISVNESRNGTTRNETDANIRRVFGSLDDFLITSMASQMDSLSFIKEGSTKRKEILAKFLDLNLFDQKFKLAKKDSSETSVLMKRLRDKDIPARIQRQEDILSEIEDDIGKTTEECEQLSNRRDELRDELAQIDLQMQSIPAKIIDIDEVNSFIDFKEKDLHHTKGTILRLIGAIAKNTEIIEEISKFCEDYDIDQLKKLRTKHSEYEEESRLLENKLKTKKTKHKSEEKKTKLLEGIPCGNQFPDCKFICDANKALNNLDQVKDAIEELTTLLSENEEKLQALEIETINEQIAKVTKLQERRETLINQIDKDKILRESCESKVELLQNELDSLRETQREYNENKHIIENLETLNREKKGISKAFKDIEPKVKLCKSAIQKFLVELGATQKNIEQLQEQENEHKDLEQDWVAYEMFMRCMHPNGIAYEVIKDKLPLINEEIAKVLANIVEFQVFFENNDKKLNINIKHPNYDARPLSMGSGAEKTIAAMAIRLALISITNLPKSELFILDEPATALDQEHMEGFVRLLEMIKNQFKTVLLISHLEALKDVVDTTIDIEKIDGYARINI